MSLFLKDRSETSKGDIKMRKVTSQRPQAKPNRLCCFIDVFNSIGFHRFRRPLLHPDI